MAVLLGRYGEKCLLRIIMDKIIPEGKGKKNRAAINAALLMKKVRME
jgi:hypothetical protein